VDALGQLKNYDAKHIKNGKLTGLDDYDKKHLRVFYEVLERYPREKLNYKEDHVNVLREIRDKMPGERKKE